MGKVQIQPEQHCVESNKLCYQSETDANYRARVLQRADPRHRERYVYRCEACGFLHLTTYKEYRPLVDDGSTPRTAAQPATEFPSN